MMPLSITATVMPVPSHPYCRAMLALMAGSA